MRLLLPIILATFMSCAKERPAPKISIIPEPVSVIANDSDESVAVSMIDYDRKDTVLASLAEKCSFRISLPPDGMGQHIVLVMDNTVTHPEGYRLVANKEGVSINGSTYNGIYYGLVTLTQLYENGRVPFVEIEDYPRFAWRGINLDVARHFLPKEQIFEFIDMLAFHKLNKFHWHLTDGIGWRIEIEQYPELTQRGAWRKIKHAEAPWIGLELSTEQADSTYGGYYTKDDIRQIVAYAAARYIEVIPEIEMPGHSEAVSFIYPQYFCTNAKPGGGVYCAGKDSSFIFLQNVLNEVAELFPSQYIHIGGDEVGKGQWMACPDCQRRKKQEHLADEHELQSYFVRRIEKHINALGKRLIGWDEISQGGLAPSATVMSWTGWQGGLDAANAGHDVIMCPIDYVYLDHYQGYHDSEPQAWGGFNSLSRVYSFPVIPPGLAKDKEHFVLGGQGNIWAENIITFEHRQYMLLPRMAALSEALWSQPTRKNWELFARKMDKQIDRYEAQGWNYSSSSMTPMVQQSGDTVRLSNELGIYPIFYSLDGSEPTTRYTEPIILESPSTLRAVTMRNEKSIGYELVINNLQSKAAAKKVIYTSPVDSHYNGGGEGALTDNRHAIKRGDDPAWQGFEQQDMNVTIDLGTTREVSEVVARFFQHIGITSVLLPTNVTVELSTDNKNFAKVSSVDIAPQTDDYNAFVEEMAFPFELQKARFVRIKAANIGTLPSWHPLSGGNAWVFCDEIAIN